MVSLIIPFYNCVDTADKTIKAVCDCLKSYKNIEFIAVDDGSTDDTVNVLKMYENNRIRVVSYPKNKGKGGAIKAGVEAAKGEKIIFTDADLAYGLEPIKRFVDALDFADIAVGTRRTDVEISKKYGIFRAAASRVFSGICESILHLGLPDTQCGFKGYRAAAAKRLFEEMTIMGFGFDFEILAMARREKLKIKSIPVTLLENSKSSNVNVAFDGLKMLREVYRIKRKIKRNSGV